MLTSAERELWLRSYHPARDAEARLVCFPHAGGSATFYHSMSAMLAPDVEVLAVQYPGRQDRRGEPLVDSIPVLADRLAAVVGRSADRPLAFFGHSMGASIAFEVARRLEADGIELALLAVSGRAGPSAPRRMARVHLGDDAAVLAEIRKLSGTDAKLLEDEEFAQVILPLVRSDYRAAETYRYSPGPDVSCPVLALVGEDDPKVTTSEAEVWCVHTSGQFELRSYPGGHFFLNDHRADINQLLTERLAISVNG